MQKVAVVTDSIGCLTRELADRYGIEVIPINFYACGRLYRDWVDITPSEAYKLFLKEPDSFKSSAASPEECLEIFRRVARRAESIFCITVSAELSATNHFVTEAREMAAAELPGLRIEVMDSRQATPSQGLVAVAAARAAAEGRDIDAVMRIAAGIRDKVSAIVLLDTIRHVYRSGRIPRIASQIGSALNIRPILTVAGNVHFAGVVRSRQQGIRRMLQMMRNKVGGCRVHAAVMHAYALDEAERLREQVAAAFDCVELWLTEFSPVMGYACGTGTVGVAFYPDD